MSGDLLIEYLETPDYKLDYIEEKAGGPKFLRFEAEIQRADVKNRNGRIYPRAVLEREVAKFQESINNGSSFGESDHPATGVPSVDKTSVIWTKVWMTEDGRVMGQAKVLNTDSGRNLKGILEGGGRPGVSSRGRGTVQMKNFKGEQSEVVNEDYNLRTFDVVIDQSVHTAVTDKVYLENHNGGNVMRVDEIKDLESLKSANGEVYSLLMKEAVKTAKADLTDEVQEMVSDLRDEVREEVIEELKGEGRILDEGETAATKEEKAFTLAVVETAKEMGLIEATVSDEEAAKKIEALEADLKCCREEKEKTEAALVDANSKLEATAVAEAAAEKCEGHTFASQMIDTLVESCSTVEEVNEAFEGVKERFDGIEEGLNEGAKAVGETHPNKTKEKAPIVEGKKVEEGKKLELAENKLRAAAGLNG